MEKKEAENLISTICAKMHVTVEDVKSKSRHEPLVVTRAIICRCLKEKKMSLMLIGSHIGGRNHATVINSLNRYQQIIDNKNDCHRGSLLQIMAEFVLEYKVEGEAEQQTQMLDQTIAHHIREAERLKKLKKLIKL